MTTSHSMQYYTLYHYKMSLIAVFDNKVCLPALFQAVRTNPQTSHTWGKAQGHYRLGHSQLSWAHSLPEEPGGTGVTFTAEVTGRGGLSCPAACLGLSHRLPCPDAGSGAWPSVPWG